MQRHGHADMTDLESFVKQLSEIIESAKVNLGQESLSVIIPILEDARTRLRNESDLIRYKIK